MHMNLARTGRMLAPHEAKPPGQANQHKATFLFISYGASVVGCMERIDVATGGLAHTVHTVCSYAAAQVPPQSNLLSQNQHADMPVCCLDVALLRTAWTAEPLQLICL